MRRTRCALVLCLPLLAGCTQLKQLAASSFEKPKLSFKDARLSEVSLGGATVNLVFDVENPNSQSLSLADTDYMLQIEGKQLVAGKPPGGIKIPAKGHGEVVLPASVKFAELGSSIASLLSKGTVDYLASGHIGVDTPIGTVGLPFEHSGKLDLPKVPSVDVGSPKLNDISLSGATLRVPLTLTNANPFALPLGAVAGTVRVEGEDVGTIDMKDVGTLAAKGKRLVEVPVKMSYRGAVTAARALKSGAARVGVRGELRSGGAAVPFNVEKDVDLKGSQAAEQGSGSD